MPRLPLRYRSEWLWDSPDRRGRGAVPSGTIRALSRSTWRWVSERMPITAKLTSSTNTTGCWPTLAMLSRCAAPAPSTATRSARSEWPWSNQRPVASRPRTAGYSPGEAAIIGIWNSLWPSGSLIGTERVRAPPMSASAIVPAATTPLSRLRRCSESHGSRARGALSPKKPPSVVTTTEVADSSLNDEMIWLPAVWATPSVATSDAIPRTAPSAVSSERPGRANSPARASAARSRGVRRARAPPAPVMAARALPARRPALRRRARVPRGRRGRSRRHRG